ncbi:MAG: YdcF family protein [Candidatus Saccharibacteria bacterium]
MIRWLIGLAVFGLLAILGLTVYLQPDELGKCGKSPSSTSGCQMVDAIVAVSGGDTKARAEEAVKLYKNGWSEKLIFSGAAQDKTGPSNASVMKTIALQSGVPESAIRLDEYAENTIQNAENSGGIFNELQIKSVILVTSGYHQRRAGLEFDKRTGDVRIINHPVSSDKDWGMMWWVTPWGWWLAISEFVKIAIFYVMGLF